MKSFLKTVRRLIHKLALVLGYLGLIAAILLGALFAIVEINKTENTKEPIVEIDNALSQWPYEPNESFDVNIYSANDQWPYEISVQWWPEREKSLPYGGVGIPGVVGRATISIIDPISGSSSTITTQYFHVPDNILTPPKSMPLEIALSDFPHPSLKASEDNISWGTPLLLEDVDFDGDLELVIINHGRGQYWVNEFEVFDVDVVSNALVVTLKNDSPFSELDGWSEFNSEKKTITIYRRGGGACRAESETYLVAGSISTPIQMVEYVNTDAECYKLTYTYQNTDTGFSKALLKKEKFQWFE